MRTNNRIVMLFLATTCCAALSATSATAGRDTGTAPALADPVRVVLPPAGVRVTTLDNGLRVVAIADPTLPMVGINVVVKVGSATESVATSGSSHMLEHLLFNGTETRTQEQLYDDVDSFGGYNNANTSRFYTNFMMLGPSQELDRMVEIQADMLLHSILPAEKLEKERGIVIEEIGQGGDDPGEDAERFLFEKCFPASPVGMPVLGNPGTISGLGRDDLYDFYKTYYVPNNMVMSVVGGFDPETLSAILERHWSAAPARPVPRPARDYSAPIPRSAAYARRGSGSSTSIGLAFEAPAYDSPGHVAFETGVDLLNRALPALLDDTAAAALTATGAHTLPWPPVGRLMVSGELAAGADAAAAAEALESTIRAWAEGLGRTLSASELSAVLARSRAEAAGLLEKPHYYGIANAERYALSDADEVQLALPARARLTPEEIARAARPLARGPVISTVLLAGAAASADTAAAARVRTERRVLANGLTLVVRNNPFAKVFAAHLLARDRVLLEGPEREGWVDLIHRLVAGQGGDRSALEFREALAALGGSLKAFDSAMIPYDDYYTSPRYSFLRLEALPEHGGAALRLLAERLRARRPSAEALLEVIESATGVASRNQSSARATSRALFDAAVLGKQHPLARATELPADAATERIEGEALEALWRELFDPGNLVVSVVTSSPADRIADILQSTLEGGPAPSKREWPPLPPTPATQVIEEDLGKEQASVRWGSVARIAPADEEALRLAVSVLSSRLQDDLRETRGLAYSLGASVSVIGDRAWIEVGGGTRPENIEEFMEGIRTIVASLASAGTTPEELEIARRALLGRMRMRQLSSMGQAFRLGVGEALHGSYTWSDDSMSRFGAVTVQEVDRAAARYLRPEHRVEVVVR